MSEKIMKKSEIIDKIKEEYPDLSKKDINKIIDMVFNTISDACIDNRSYTQNNFGKFELKKRSKRKGRNMETGEIINIPEANTIKYNISKTLFKNINKK